MATNKKQKQESAITSLSESELPGLEQLSVIVNKLRRHQDAIYFNDPVDPVALGIPDYLQVIKTPMDLGSVHAKLQQGKYNSPSEVIRDVNLVWFNATTYNPPENAVHQMAQQMHDVWEELVLASSKRKPSSSSSGSLPSTPTPKPNAPPVQSPAKSLAQIANQLADIVQKTQDTSGRQLAELFIELPSPQDYPDYYQIIQDPISLAGIRSKADLGQYTKPEDISKDFMLMFANAQLYNITGSLVWQDAQTLRAVFVKEFSKLFPTVSVASPIVKPLKRRVSETRSSSQKKKRKHEDSDSGEGNNANGGSPGSKNLPFSIRRKKKTKKSSNSKKDSEDDYEDEDEEDSKEPEDENTENNNNNNNDTPLDIMDEESEDSNSDSEDDGKPKKKIVDLDEEVSESIIEKILADRAPKMETKDENESQTTTATTQPISDAHEYFIKWKGKSFLHSAWLKEADLKSDPLSRTKVNRYWQAKQKQSIQGTSEVVEDEIFPPEYCEVDRVLAEKIKIDPSTGKEAPYYLIKWKSLPYSESTWERPIDFNDDEKIQYFKKINVAPSINVINAQLKPSAPTRKFVKYEKSPEFKNDNELRAYQLEGMNWLAFCWYERRGSILADEMGLGKTVQSITLLWYLSTMEKIPGPFLVVAPLSTIGHWQRELEEWTDLNVVVYQGNKSNRELTRKYEFYFSENGVPQPSKGFKFHVLLTTYEMILSQDWMELQKIKWKVLITDEAQRLKNQASKLLTNLKMFKIEHRVLLTGTPLQNNTQELWTLLNFIEPQKFASIKDFMSQFGQLEDSEQVAKLHTVLRPHILRRMKEHVEKSIPPKEETIVEVELTSLQKKYYRAILEKNREFLNKGCNSKNVPNLLNVVMQLRKVCNHPFLIPGVEEKEVPSGIKEDYFSSFVQSSGKMVLLDKLLPKLKEGGHKVLIFSQMMRVLDLLETYLRSRGYIYERLDGSIRGNERQASIDRFCKPGSDRFVFLLCTRAGGLGINLVAADTVVIYDSDWNPQNDIQAQARCHRIGQTQEVKVYRLITSKTYERKMFERSSKKLGLDQAVLHGMGGPTTSSNKPALDKKEIDSLLKYGAFDIFRDDDKESEKRFYEEDIDQILDRSSKVVWTENSAKMMGNNTFSKATFQFNAADTQVDIDDPNFWDLVLPEAKTAEKLLEKLIAGTALGTKEKKEIFLADIAELVDEVISAFQNGRPDSVSKMRSVLIGLFNELRKGKILEFSKDQQRKITEWADEVERPRRERRQISRFGGIPDYQRQPFKKKEKRRRRSHDSDNEFESDQDDSDETGEILNGWSEKERKRFHSAFMSLGPTRWEDIKTRAQVDKTDQQMREYAIDFIKQCIIHADEFDRNHFIECLDVIISHQQDQEVEIEVELQPSYTRLISKRLRAWVKNLKLIKALNEFCGSKPTMESVSVAKFPFRPITRWWTQEEDKSLLLGIRKYGLGAFDKIRNDPEFTFINFNAVIAEAEEEEKKKNEQEDLPKQPSEQSTSDVPQQQQPIVQEVKQEPIKEEPVKEGPVKQEPVKEESPADSMKIDSEPNTTEPTTTEPISAEGQATSADKKSKKKKKKGPKPAAEVPPIDPSTLSATWPSNKTLEVHFRLLMDHVRKLGEKEERKARQTEMRRREREHVWSKREQGDFRAALLTFGPGSWDRIRRKAALHKTVEQIEQYYQQLMRQCKDIISGNPDMEEKDDESERLDSNSKNLPLSSMMARRLLKFMKLMDDIRERMLPSPELTDKLHKAQPLDLPSWWLSPEHDLVLLQNVGRFGIGTRKWDKFLEDKNCPLYLNSSGKPEHRKSRYKFLTAFFKDKTAVLKRLEYLRLLVLDPAACLDLHKKRGPIRADSYPFVTQRFTRSLSGHLTPEAKKKLEEEAMMQQDVSDHVKLNLNFKTTIKDVVRDKDGKPILPIVAKGASIVNLGTIVHDRSAFHSKNYIWPIGFKSIRKLPSVKNSREYVTYASEIIDGGSAPMFQVSCVDDPTFSLQHTTSSGVWVEALKLIKKRPNVSVSGPEMYGFSDPVVKMLIQELPNAKLCTGYEWKEYHFPSLTTDLPTSVRDSSEKRIEKDSETAFDKDESGPSTPSGVSQDKDHSINNNNNLSSSANRNDAMDIDSSSDDGPISQGPPPNLDSSSSSDSEGSSSSASEDDLDVE